MTITVATQDLRAETLGRVTNYSDPTVTNKRLTRLLAENAKTFEPLRVAWADFTNTIQLSDDYDEIFAAATKVSEMQGMQFVANIIGDELRNQQQQRRAARPDYTEHELEPALRFLNDQLQALMADVRAQEPPLEGVTDATQALRAGGAAQDAWARLVDLVDRYATIRSVQREVTIVLGPEDGRPNRIEQLNRSGHLAAAFDHEAVFLRIRSLSYPTGGRGRHSGEEKWIDWVRATPRIRFDRPVNDVFPGDAIGFVRWVSQGDKGWVPTIEELATFDDLAMSMMTRLPVKTLHEHRDRYYKTRGLTPQGPPRPLPARTAGEGAARSNGFKGFSGGAADASRRA